jgi:NADPH-dependent curcumin reductase CurA
MNANALLNRRIVLAARPLSDAASYAAPGAFLGLMEGRNFGKLIVDVGGAAA